VECGYTQISIRLRQEQGLGTDWTPPLAGAWTEADKTLADYMIADASAARPSQVGHSWSNPNARILSSEVIVDVRN
jgi:hypothetical protein